MLYEVITGIGGYSFQSKENLEKARAVIKKSTELGVTLIDTAPTYKDSEDVIGEVLKNFDRDKLIVSSKYYPYSPVDDKVNFNVKDMFDTVDRSLKRLGTDYLDILHFHWVHNAEDINAIINSKLADAMHKLKSEVV